MLEGSVPQNGRFVPGYCVLWDRLLKCETRGVRAWSRFAAGVCAPVWKRVPWFAPPFRVHRRDPGQIGPAGHSRGIGAGRIRPRPCGALHRNRLPLSKANGAADSRAGGELLRAATPRVAGRSPGTECSNSMSLTFSQNEITRNSFARTAPMNPESTKAATKVARKVHGQPRCERTA